MTEREDRLWIPDNPDGSGWALIDWSSVLAGRRYHYRHTESLAEASEHRPGWYRIVTRLETSALSHPHENDYYVEAGLLADFLAEFAHVAGAETIWHIETVDAPPAEALASESSP